MGNPVQSIDEDDDCQGGDCEALLYLEDEVNQYLDQPQKRLLRIIGTFSFYYCCRFFYFLSAKILYVFR